MAKAVHPVAGAIALALISTFWLSTLLSELLAGPAVVTLVKTTIPWGFLILIPAMAAVGLSGRQLARNFRGPVVAAKQKRMAVIAGNGVLVLVPSALFLAASARAGEFGTAFVVVQVLELAAGATNIVLMVLNMRDGLRFRR
ncbi:hypothetical protein [Chachezhania sediminis]|uniref:hypothetical protein n=1 Tax=Chachezhania sediminis TaxID=2599291 RepID=UPI00131B28CA|nr:hypothetical protein [Chachezhania sediminis]